MALPFAAIRNEGGGGVCGHSNLAAVAAAGFFFSFCRLSPDLFDRCKKWEVEEGVEKSRKYAWSTIQFLAQYISQEEEGKRKGGGGGR